MGGGDALSELQIPQKASVVLHWLHFLLQCHHSVFSEYTEFLIALEEVQSGDREENQYPGLRGGWRGQKLPGWAC